MADAVLNGVADEFVTRDKERAPQANPPRTMPIGQGASHKLVKIAAMSGKVRDPAVDNL
ncbi:hypothetical protein [Tropicimonas isoalkanivorans]|uniref:hypothetical protein n=1 Tax=Tropicimonas isoalkanivorans TaxID=441112 RepID=UPI0015A5C486|nr:hypothetical protein [Tropicimonas isoalkanivorans]